MNSNSFSLLQEHHEAEQTTKVDILRTGHKKKLFFDHNLPIQHVVKFHHCRAAETSNTKVSPLRMLQTGETIPPEKHVRIKLHQSEPSRLVKLTTTAKVPRKFFKPSFIEPFFFVNFTFLGFETNKTKS